MSNTRHAPAGAPLRQERFCSAVQFDEGLKALPVARRAELIASEDLRALLWFLQFRSLPPREEGIGRVGGMARIAEEVFPAVHDAISSRGGIRRERLDLSVALLRPSVDEEEWREAVVHAIASALTDFCLNPASATFPSLRVHFAGDSTVDAPDLPSRCFLDVLQAYRLGIERDASLALADTDHGRRVRTMLRFTFETGRACLIEGPARTGKTTAAKAFCEAHAGRARYVQTPPGIAEQDLLRAVADAIGVADSTAYKNVQIRQAVEEVLRRSRLCLVFDEAQWLLPAHVRVQSLPQRLLWVKQLIDWSVPVAFVALPDFTRLLANVGRKTGWAVEQITGRVVFERLPAEVSEPDLRAIFAHQAPCASTESADLIVGTAMTARDQAGCIAKLVDFARFLARGRGAYAPAFEDFRRAALAHNAPSQAVGAAVAEAPQRLREIPAERSRSQGIGGRIGALATSAG
jgi:hypothetical protein